MVQHYFRTKDEMMVFALDMVSRSVQARSATAAPDDVPAPRGLVRALPVQMLPLDGERAAQSRVALAFFAHAAVRPHVAAELHANTVVLRAFFADRIRAAGAVSDLVSRSAPGRPGRTGDARRSPGPAC
ncbi:MAG TPA: TetR family transcriptional regulator C-terminal domain-containing protein [Pseudonocardia sp.]|jgi:AcrR family transcriptional regulator